MTKLKGQFTKAQLRKELKRLEVEEKTKKGKKLPPNKKGTKKRDTLSKKTKEDIEDQEEINKVLKQQAQKRATEKAKRKMTYHREKVDKRLKKAGKLEPKGKYERTTTWVHLALWYKVALYDSTSKRTEYYEHTVDEFIGIKWNENRLATFKAKMREAEDELFARIEGTLESNAEIVAHKFAYTKEINRRELNKHNPDPSDVKMYGTKFDYEGMGLERTISKAAKAQGKREMINVMGQELYDKVVCGLTEDEDEDPQPILYKWIPADLNAVKDGYMCTDSYLLREYGYLDGVEGKQVGRIKSLCKEKLDAIMGKTDDGGRTVKMVDKFCKEYNISHYALDWQKRTFFKEIRGRSYKALMYFCMSNHMYPITDAATRESTSKRNAAKSSKSTAGTNLKAQLSEKETQEQSKKTIERFELTKKEDTPLINLFIRDKDGKYVVSRKYENCNIFYHEHTLYPLYIAIYTMTNVAYETRYVGTNMTCIILEEANVHLYANMNHRTLNPEKRDMMHKAYDWNDVKIECEAMGVPFTNQSFTQLGKAVQERFDIKGKKKHIRVQFDDNVRESIWKEQGKRCKCCSQKVGRDGFEIDHIISLARNGDNSRENLQALCKGCHDQKTRKEAAERAFDTDNTVSDYNEDTLKIFSVAKNGFIHNFDVGRKWKIPFGLDVNKCRTEIVLRMQYEWCVFSVFDGIRKFDVKKHREIPRGIYRVITNNYLPFKGTGWYTYPLIIKSLKAGIISLKDISHCVLASFALPANYYVKFIEYIRKTLKNKNLAKLIVNMFIGSMGHKVSKHRSLFLTKSMNEAAYHKFATAEDDAKRVHVKMNSKVKNLMEVVTSTTRYSESNQVPQFNQILDMEAWELYEIECLLKKHGCKRMIYYNTDNAIGEFTNPEDVAACEKEAMNIFWDKEKKFPKYKPSHEIHNMTRVERDEHGDNLVEKLKAGKVDRPLKYEEPEYTQLYKDNGSMDFSGLVRTMARGNRSFQIQGRAGCGKSHFLQEFMRYLHDQDISFMSLCPHHKACRRLDAGLDIFYDDDVPHQTRTLDSQWAVIKHTGSDPFNKVNWVIIDEKSFIKEGFWRSLLAIVHRFPKSQFVISGDWNQLPGVCDRSDSFDYENSKAIWEICAGRMIEFTHCRRTDETELFEMCKNVNAVDLSTFPSEECEKSLAYNNSVRIAVNRRWMLKKRGNKYLTLAGIVGMEKHTQEMFVYKGLPVIAIGSQKKLEIANADDFRVLGYNDETIRIGALLEDETIDKKKIIEVPIKEFAGLLQPAYSVSVHRSQCSTYRVPYTIYQIQKMKKMDSDNGKDLGARLLYVGLSRAASLSLINISNEYD